jgi:hypothetical protein
LALQTSLLLSLKRETHCTTVYSVSFSAWIRTLVEIGELIVLCLTPFSNQRTNDYVAGDEDGWRIYVTKTEPPPFEPKPNNHTPRKNEKRLCRHAKQQIKGSRGTVLLHSILVKPYLIGIDQRENLRVLPTLNIQLTESPSASDHGNNHGLLRRWRSPSVGPVKDSQHQEW